MMSIRTILLCFATTCVCAGCSSSLAPTSPPPSTPTTPTTFGLTGQVVQAGTTTGIASAALLLVDSSGNAMNSVSDSTGAFAFGVTLASGTYTLQTTAPGYRGSVAIVSIPVTNLTVQLPLVGASPVTSVAIAVTGQSSLTIGQTTQLTANVVVLRRHSEGRDGGREMVVDEPVGGGRLLHRRVDGVFRRHDGRHRVFSGRHGFAQRLDDVTVANEQARRGTRADRIAHPTRAWLPRQRHSPTASGAGPRRRGWSPRGVD